MTWTREGEVMVEVVMVMVDLPQRSYRKIHQ
jgi:hypothetical protein